MKAKRPAPRDEEKYTMYHLSVQDPDNACDFMENVYRDHARRDPRVMREDFCGTFANARAWVARGPKYRAFGIDKDPKPMAFGRWRAVTELAPSQLGRLGIRKGDVLKAELDRADIACALNFSYFVFKHRAQLKEYFRRCHDSLSKKGLLFLDVLGVTEARRPLIETKELFDFKYIWELKSFNPVTRDIRFHMHFEQGKRRWNRAFSYDWRLWTVPEVREILQEVGFKRVSVFWQGYQSVKVLPDEIGESWVAYLAALK